MKKYITTLAILVPIFFMLGFTSNVGSPLFFDNTTLAARIIFISEQWSNMEAETPKDYEAMYTWVPEVGVRGKYFIARSILSLETVERMVGVPIYDAGPHTNGMDFSSNKQFGYYNPAFLSRLKDNIEPLLQENKFVEFTQKWYDQHLKNYLRTYEMAYHVGFNKKEYVDLYLRELANYTEDGSNSSNPPGWSIQDPFADFASQMEGNGYDYYEASSTPGFWVRRTIDGTGNQFYELLEMVLKTYDPTFLKK